MTKIGAFFQHNILQVNVNMLFNHNIGVFIESTFRLCLLSACKDQRRLYNKETDCLKMTETFHSINITLAQNFLIDTSTGTSGNISEQQVIISDILKVPLLSLSATCPSDTQQVLYFQFFGHKINQLSLKSAYKCHIITSTEKTAYMLYPGDSGRGFKIIKQPIIKTLMLA